MKNFISRLKAYIKVHSDKLLSVHTFLSVTTESKMYENWKTSDRNLYSMFLGWLLENLWYGLIISSSLIMFGVQFRWYLPFTVAGLYWICIDTIDRITNIIRSK